MLLMLADALAAYEESDDDLLGIVVNIFVPEYSESFDITDLSGGGTRYARKEPDETDEW